MESASAAEAAQLRAEIAKMEAAIAHQKAENTVAAQNSGITTPFSHQQRTIQAQRGSYRGAFRGPTSYRRGGMRATYKNSSLVNNARQGAESRQTASSQSQSLSNEQSTPAHPTSPDVEVAGVNEPVTARALSHSRMTRNRLDKAKLKRHLQNVRDHAQKGSAPPHTKAALQLDIQGIRFFVAESGSKLVRDQDEANLLHKTPKSATVAGVSFSRTKHGNLVRTALLKSKQRDHAPRMHEPCRQFTSTGTCSYGTRCDYMHDADKVAVCRTFLSQGYCPLGDSCDLSHELTAARVPPCVHFQRDACTNAHCRYPHIKMNPAAPVCKAFARLGYCDRSDACPERHVHECPEYADKGSCSDPRCKLPHIDRAAKLRQKTAANLSGNGESDEQSDVSSVEETFDSDDANSDDMDDDNDPIFVSSGFNEGHEISQQADFIRF